MSVDKRSFHESVALVNKHFRVENPPPGLVSKAKEILEALKLTRDSNDHHRS